MSLHLDRILMPLALRRKLPVLIIIGAIFFVYAGAVSGSFVWDDQTIVVRNEAIRDFGNLPYVFTNQFAEKVNYGGNIYRPVQEMSYAVDYFLWALDPAGFHITNILLHTACAVAIFYLITAVSRSRHIAFFAALIFGIHPLNTEAIAYISGRSDPLFFLFLTLAFLFYVNAERKRIPASITPYFFACFCYALSLLSRETAVVFPFLLISYNALISKTKGIGLKKIMPFFALLALYAVLRIYVIELNKNRSMFLDPQTAIFTNIKVVAEYLKIILFPFRLHMERWLPLSKALDPSVVLSLFLLAPFAAFIFLIREKRNIFFWAVWFIIFLIPNLNILRLNALYAEHWIYAGAVGVYVLFAYILNALMDKRGLRRILALLIMGFTIAYLSVFTIIRNFDWNNEPAIYLNTLKFTPSPKVMSNLGVYYDINKEYGEAIKMFQGALKICPNETWYHNNIALSYLKNGNKEKAIYHWSKSLNINPDQNEIRGYINKYK